MLHLNSGTYLSDYAWSHHRSLLSVSSLVVILYTTGEHTPHAEEGEETDKEEGGEKQKQGGGTDKRIRT
jgi:hypothetical protein